MIWNNFVKYEIVETLGWTLIHSVWQIAFVALALFFLLKILRKVSANFRYSISVFALGLASFLPVITFIQISRHAAIGISHFENSQLNYEEKIKPNLSRSEDLSLPATDESQFLQNADEKSLFVNLYDFFGENISRVLPFAVFGWLFGMMIFAIRFGGGVWQLRKFKTCEIFTPDKEWQERFSGLTEKLKIWQKVKFLRSNLIETPVVIGWLKPVILIPASVFLQISSHELETIIAHELIHIRRCDALVNFIQGIFEILFFYHPCLWWISATIRNEREFAADEAVIESLENSLIVYANALANLEELRLSVNQILPFLKAAANGGNLMQRITKILQKKNEIKRSSTTAWSAMLSLSLLSAVLLCVFSLSPTTPVNARTETKKIAIGFVSIPPLDRTANSPKDADATMRLLIEKLKAHNVPAIGFLQGSMISDGERLSPVRAGIARLWRDSGLEIGIGNFNHVWFYNTPYDEYVAGVEKNEAVAKKLLGEKNFSLRYFSYPYLNTGKNADERNRFEAWLRQRGIMPVKYTIDNQEWMYSYAYDAARNNNDVNTMKQVQSQFLEYMSKMFVHFEQYSQEMFGRNINQTMVLTPSRLVTDSSEELFGMIEKRGYQFVSMDEALNDEAYKTPENFYGESGISWFERWQMARGKKLLDEPSVDTLVYQLWKDKKPPKPPPAPARPASPSVAKPLPPSKPPVPLNPSIGSGERN